MSATVKKKRIPRAPHEDWHDTSVRHWDEFYVRNKVGEKARLKVIEERGAGRTRDPKKI